MPIENYRFSEVGEFWAYTYRNVKEFLNPEFRKYNDWEVFIFDAPIPEEFKNAHNSHMRANLLFEDTWVDLHLSVTDMKTSEELHDVLFEYLKTVQIQK